MGCINDAAYYCGVSCQRAIKPPVQKTLIEQEGGGNESTAFQYCDAIRRHLLGKDNPEFLDKDELAYRMGARHVV